MPERHGFRKSVLGAVLGEALTAVHGLVAPGLEGHLGGLAAAIADHVIHLAFATVATVLTAGGAAGGAAAGLVLEALLGVESLFGSGEDEFGAALTAGEGLVLIHGTYLLIILPNRMIRSGSFPGLYASVA